VITSAQYAIASTAVKIAGTGVGHRTVHIAPIGNTTVYLSGSNQVTSSTGYGLNKALGEHDVLLGPADELWAICAAAQTETVTVLISEG
jgi:hypothetical protein